MAHRFQSYCTPLFTSLQGTACPTSHGGQAVPCRLVYFLAKDWSRLPRSPGSSLCYPGLSQDARSSFKPPHHPDEFVLAPGVKLWSLTPFTPIGSRLALRLSAQLSMDLFMAFLTYNKQVGRVIIRVVSVYMVNQQFSLIATQATNRMQRLLVLYSLVLPIEFPL